MRSRLILGSAQRTAFAALEGGLGGLSHLADIAPVALDEAGLRFAETSRGGVTPFAFDLPAAALRAFAAALTAAARAALARPARSLAAAALPAACARGSARLAGRDPRGA